MPLFLPILAASFGAAENTNTCMRRVVRTNAYRHIDIQTYRLHRKSLNLKALPKGPISFFGLCQKSFVLANLQGRGLRHGKSINSLHFRHVGAVSMAIAMEKHIIFVQWRGSASMPHTTQMHV